MTYSKTARNRYLYGRPQPEPLICTRCGRVTCDHDPDVKFSHGEVVACGSCEITAYEINRKACRTAERQVSLDAAERYCALYPKAYILGNRFLYHLIGNTHKVIAEITKGETCK